MGWLGGFIGWLGGYNASQHTHRDSRKPASMSDAKWHTDNARFDYAMDKYRTKAGLNPDNSPRATPGSSKNAQKSFGRSGGGRSGRGGGGRPPGPAQKGW